MPEVVAKLKDLAYYVAVIVLQERLHAICYRDVTMALGREAS
jgi:hypothetical protein